MSVSPVDDYSNVSPIWLETVSTAYIEQASAQLNFAVIPSQSNDVVGASPSESVAEYWIVRFTRDALSRVRSVGETARLLEGSDVDFSVVRGLGLPGLVLVDSGKSDVGAVEASLDANPHVASFERNQEITGQAVPDDPEFGNLYGLHNTGQTGGTADADIDAPEAWEIATGSYDVVVGVIDSGVDPEHADLYLNIWLNQGEIPPEIAANLTDIDSDGLITFGDLNDMANANYAIDSNGNGYIDAHDLLADPTWADGNDTDGNQYVDDFFGWDFQGNDNDPMDDSRHGTHVAGTIAAAGNNGVGVTGVNWRGSIMGLRFLDENNQGSTQEAILAINYATMMRSQHGVNVLLTNNSWGYRGNSSPNLRAAIQASGNEGMLFVAAAGNGDVLGRGFDNDEDPEYAFYPASEDLENVISVAATDSNDCLARFSNFGQTSVDIAAPGTGIVSTEPGDRYKSRYGTSMATPHVSGAAALLWSHVPDATAAEVRNAILASADPVGELQGKLATGGRLNLHGALLVDTAAPQAALTAAPDITGPGDTEQLITVDYTDNRALDVTGLGQSDIVVTRLWDAYEMPGITLDSVNPQLEGRLVTAVYRVPAPDGTWGTMDDGDYEISLRADEVYDASYNFTQPVSLGTFNIDTTEGLFRADTFHDAVDADPGNGASDDGTGKSTLRAAVMEANATAGDNVIRLRPGTYTLSIDGAGEDSAWTGDLDITENLTVRGAGADKTTIDAAGLDRLFHVLPGVTLSLSGVTITGGSADSGGGILNAGTLTVTDATVRGNSTGGTGGGIANQSTATISQSTLSGNLAADDGGGFHNTGTATITNSTISGNWTTGAGSSGGGISNQIGASLTSINNTIAQNVAVARGGGIDSGGTANATNTIIALNTAPSGPDVYGAVTSSGYNLIGAEADSAGWLVSDLLNTDPLLGPLEDNGGPTFTHALLPDSPAIDAGTATDAPTIDQRGIERPQDGDGDGTDTLDMGAVERFLGEIHGVRFRDFNGDGIQDPSEPGLAGLTMYLDLNNNGDLDPGEPSTETDAAGAYSFTDLDPSAFAVAEVLQDGWQQTLENLGLETELVSLASGGLYGDGNSGRSSISADGRYVAFYSVASNLVRGDTNHQSDVFVYDRQNDTIKRVSLGSDGLQANEASSAPSISADGRFVAFQSLASNLVPEDTNDEYDVFVFDRQTDTVQLVSPAFDGSVADDQSLRPSISADGRYVAFSSEASNLVADDTNGMTDVFVHDRQSDTTERVSLAWNGAEGDHNSTWASVSAAGRYVAFYSYASNLVQNDTNGLADAFVFDRQTDTIERVSVASDGSQADGGSSYLAISADGRYVAFNSTASNLVDNDTNNTSDVFVFDRDLDTTERVSVAGDGSETNYASYGPSISADGRYVAFHSYATNLVSGDTNFRQDVFVYDRQGDSIERVSLAIDGSQANNHSTWTSISADGSYTAFESDATNLVNGDANARTDIFVHDRQEQNLEAVSLASYGPQGNDDSDRAAINDDGRYVAFSSRASNLVPGDTNDEYDVFLYDRATDRIERVSVAADGSQGDAESGWGQPPSISADGRFVAFGSNANNLVPGDDNYFTDVFVHDRQDGTVRRVSLADDGVTQGDEYSSFPTISADGRYVAFQSVATNLVPGDDNGAYDIFVFGLETDTLQRVSVAADGSEGNNQSSYPSISADGRFVVFQSLASNLVAEDTNDTYDVFVFDRKSDTVERVSLAFDGAQGNGESTRPSISADGRYVAFSSGASNLVPGDTNDEYDVFVYDRLADTIERVSLAVDGSQGNGPSSYTQPPSIGAYGRYVVFASDADNLVPGDGNFFADIFVHDRQAETIERVSVAADGAEANWINAYPTISADGRYMAFQSVASNLQPGDANGASDIFVTANLAAWRTGARTVSVTPGEIVSGIDFGNRPLKGEIHGQKFYDLDRDGFRDGDELGLKDWTIYLDSDGNGKLDPGERSTLTDGAGAYSFTNLTPLATYTVAELQQDFWVQTFPRLVDGGTWTVQLDAGTVVTDVDFGNDYRGPGGQDLDVVVGRHFRDSNQNGIQDAGEPGLEGRTVYLDLDDNGNLDGPEPWTVTDSEGGYSFDGLAPGNYAIRTEPVLNWIQTAPLKNSFTSNQFGDGELDQTQSVAVGDFDGDSDNDLAVANGNYVSLMMNDGNGSFGIPVNIPLGTRAVGAQSVAAGYFDDDENLDLAVTNYLSSNVSVLLGGGDGSFASAMIYPVGIFPRSVAVGDLDGDGDSDLAVANEYDGNLSILRNDGSGSFTADPVRPTAETNPFFVITGQFNDDDNNGRIDDDDALDLAVANFGDPFENYSGSGVSVLLNNGSGSFSTKVNVPGGNGSASVAAGDLDGDGDLDLAVANFASDDVSILLNLGNGSFVRWPQSLPAGTGPFAVMASDMDGDSDLDLIVTNATPDHLAVLHNLSVPGELSFTPPQSFGVGNFPTSISFSVIAGPFNDDDAMDLAVANGEGNNVSVLLNSIYPGVHRVTLTGVDPVGGIDFGSRLNNEAPTLDAIADATPIDEDAGEQTLNLTGIGAGGSEVQPLIISATSDNPGLIPDPTVNYSPPASTGALSYTPATNRSGIAVITVTVTDGGPDGQLGTGFDNETLSRTFTVTVNPTGDDPVADAGGPYVVAEGGAIQLDASRTTDPDLPNDALSYAWDLDGDGQFDDATGISPTFSAASLDGPGAVIVGLRVTDNDGATDTTTTTVNLTNVAPTAHIGGPFTILEGSTLTLDASGSTDPGDDIARYEWDLDGDGVYDDATGATAAFISTEDGTFTIGVRVTDRDGDWDTATAQVIVDNAGFRAGPGGPYTVAEGSDVVLDASGSSDPGGDIVLYEWDLDFDGQYDDATGITALFHGSRDGDFAVGLRVTEDGGETDTAAAPVTVTNVPPVATLGGPSIVDEGIALALDASGSTDPGQDIVLYEWDLDGDGTYDDATGVTTTFASEADGTFMVGVRVTDDAGDSDTATAQVTVNNVAPTAGAGGPYTVDEGGEVLLDASSSTDPGNDIVLFEWDLDNDGEYDDSTGITAVFSAGNVGTITVGVRVTDDDGDSGTATAQVTVNNVAPTAAAGGPYTVEKGGNVLLDASASTDPGNDIVLFEWDLDNDGEYDDSTGITTGFTAVNVGAFTVGVRVTDIEGDWHTDVTQVGVVTEDLGPADFLQRNGLDPSSGVLWYRLETIRAGFSTIEAIAEGAAAGVSIELFESVGDDTPLAISAPIDGIQRIDYPVGSGETYFVRLSGNASNVDLRVANLLNHVGTTISVYGTDGDDTFEFDASASRVITINGVRYALEDAEVEAVSFQGGDAYDTVVLRDSPGNETLESRPGFVSFSNGEGSFSVNASGFEEMHAYAKAGGDDTAILHDSPRNDKFKFEPERNYAKLYGGLLYHRVKFFDVTYAYSSAGEDLARLFGSTGDDTFQGQKDASRLITSQYDVTVGAFSRVIAYAGNGGTDTAILTDSALKDEFHGKSHKSEMFDILTDGDIYRITARRFDDVCFMATNREGQNLDGGRDKAKFWDTPLSANHSGDDYLEARYDDNDQPWVSLSTQKTGLDMLYETIACEWVKAYGSTGTNTLDKAAGVDFLMLAGDWNESP